MKVLLSCPPMIKNFSLFEEKFKEKDIEVVIPDFNQTLSEEELMELLPTMDAWIIGDDLTNEKIISNAVKGKFKAAIKWGVGVDNIDFESFKKYGIPVTNTPNMFGADVAEIALSFLLSIFRFTHLVDKELRNDHWIKPSGNSLVGKNVGVLGYGDIGKETVKRLLAFDTNICVYDPYADKKRTEVSFLDFPNNIENLDALIVTCSLNKSTNKIINASILNKMKDGVKLVNVSRGQIIDEEALKLALNKGKVSAVGLDVFENEPISMNNSLLESENSIFGTHNSSNTIEGVIRASEEAITKLFEFLKVK